VQRLVTYLPILLHDQGESFWLASVSLSVLQAAGVVGAMVGGTLSDRLGRRWMLFAAVLPTSIFMFVFLVATSWARFPVSAHPGLYIAVHHSGDDGAGAREFPANARWRTAFTWL